MPLRSPAVTNPLPTQARLHALIDAHRARPGATLPMLHAIQDSFGYVPDEALPMIASALNLSRAEIQGVVSFYFRRSPPGRHIVQICRAESCPGDGRGSARGPRQGTTRRRLSSDHRRRHGDAGAGVLPRQLRLFAGDTGG